MRGRKVGPTTQDTSGGYTPKDSYPINAGKRSGKTRTASVSAPTSLKSGTRAGTGGTQQPVGSTAAQPGQKDHGGFVPSFGKK